MSQEQQTPKDTSCCNDKTCDCNPCTCSSCECPPGCCDSDGQQSCCADTRK